MESKKNFYEDFSLLIFDPKDRLVFYDLDTERMKLWIGGFSGEDCEVILGQRFLPLLAATKARTSLGNGLRVVAGHREGVLVGQHLGHIVLVVGNGPDSGHLGHVFKVVIKVRHSNFFKHTNLLS